MAVVFATIMTSVIIAAVRVGNAETSWTRQCQASGGHVVKPRRTYVGPNSKVFIGVHGNSLCLTADGRIIGLD